MSAQRAVAVEPSEDAIRTRSRQIWESEGRPDGYAEIHWERARSELAEQLAKMANTHRPRPTPSLAPPQPLLALPAPSAVEAPKAVAGPAEMELPKPAAPKTESAKPALRLRKIQPLAANIMPSIICGGLVFRGVLESAGEMQFDGCLEGEIHAARLHVGEDAVIAGEVTAEELTVRGSITGFIRARKVLLCAGCSIEGEVAYEAVTIEDGARLAADFRRLAEAVSKPARAETLTQPADGMQQVA